MIDEEEIVRLRARLAEYKEIDATPLFDEIERLKRSVREVTEVYKPGWAQGLHALAIQLGWVEDKEFAGDYCPASFLDDKMREVNARAEKAERERDEARAACAAMRAALEKSLAEYENGCHHAWKALPTRYDGVLDEHTAAGETRDDVNRRADWIETAIRDMGGDLERAEQDRDATRAANIESKRQRDCALVVLKQAEEALRVVHGHLGVGEHKPSDLYGWERAVVAALATLEGLRR